MKNKIPAKANNYISFFRAKLRESYGYEKIWYNCICIYIVAWFKLVLICKDKCRNYTKISGK